MCPKYLAKWLYQLCDENLTTLTLLTNGYTALNKIPARKPQLKVMFVTQIKMNGEKVPVLRSVPT